MKSFTARSLIGLFLLLFTLLSWASSLQESPTYDEPNHLTSGYLYWRTGHYFLDPIHPPLARLWVSLPLLTLYLPNFYPPPRRVIEQRISLPDWLLNGQGIRGDRLIARGRIMVLLLAVALGLFLVRWAWEIWGPFEAVAAAGLYAFCPTLLAYSHLITTDYAMAAACVVSLYFFWRYEQSPSLPRALLAGVFMGMALMTKFPAVLMLPVVGVIAVGYFLQRRPSIKTDYHLLSYVLGLVVVVLTVYRFHELYRIGLGMQDLHAVLTARAGQYFHGHFNVGSPWPWFFSVCFLLKTPLPFLGLLLFGAGAAIPRHYPRARVAIVWWIFPTVFYLLCVSWANDQMGIRRILLLYPFLVLWGAGAFAVLYRSSRMGKIAAIVLALWYMGETLLTFPLYFSYFNVLAGGPSNGFHYLVDCNSDWGQALPGLARYINAQHVSTFYLCYFGAGTPADYGIRYVPVGPDTKLPALPSEPKTLLAISATALAGACYDGRDPFAWLRSRTPQAVIDGSLLIFDLTHG